MSPTAEQAFATSIPSTIAVVETVPIGQVVPSPLNPRKTFGDLSNLAQNIAAQGVLVPLIVRLDHAEHYEIVDGERRFRASQIAGVTTLPVLVRDLTDDEVMEIQLLTAIQRQDLTPLEEARGYRQLITSNPSRYSAAYIADRISRSEKYVVDRMRLLALVPELQRLLDKEVIGVGHGELLAKLKPEDQIRALGAESADNYRARGGLWDGVGQTLDLEDDEEWGEDAREADPYRRLKPVTVKELEAWIARHVRFDVAHAVETAPLDFGPTAIAVERAQALPGRGKKVIAITADYRVEDDARADERVYGAQSWKRADGTEGTSRAGKYGGEVTDSPTCEHSVLGVFAVGPGYGTAIQVCIARDRCQVHWAQEIKERKKNAKLRASGQGATANAREKTEQESWEVRQAREKKERARQVAAYTAVYPQIVDAIREAVPATLDRTMFAFLYRGKAPDVKPAKFTETLVLREVTAHKPDEWRAEHALGEVLAIAKHFGVDTKAFQKGYTQHVAAALKAETAAAAPATTKKAPVKAKRKS